MTGAVHADWLAEHAAGASVRQIAKRHGISRSTVHRTILKEGSRLIGELENELRVAELTEAEGGQATWPTCLIPPQVEPDWRAAMAMFFWARDRLVERGWAIEVITRQVPGGGTCFMLTTGRNDQ
jgi:hypothetical protein